MRGDVYDGRNFVKSSLAGEAPDQGKHKPQADLDLDIKLGMVVGHNGEPLRGLDLRLSRRAGQIRSFTHEVARSGATPRSTAICACAQATTTR